MLIDIKVHKHFDPSVVAGELQVLGLRQIDVYGSVMTIRGLIGKRQLPAIEDHEGVESAAESDGERIHASLWPVHKPGISGLGLCDSRKLLSPQQLAELDRDLERLADSRRLPGTIN